MVRRPKTELHPVGLSRLISLFPELRPYLEEAFERAKPRTEIIIIICRDSKTNLRTRLKQIIRRAGL